MSAIVNQPNTKGGKESLNAKQEGVYAAPLPPHVNYDASAIPEILSALLFTEVLVVKQKKEMMEIVCGCETKNKYEIFDQSQQTIFFAEERSDCLWRFLCGPLRPVLLEIKNKDENCVMALDRPISFMDAVCYLPCTPQKMSIYSPPGHLIGCVEKQPEIFPELHVKDDQHAVVFKIKHPGYKMYWGCGDISFPIFAADGINECGRIAKGHSDILTQIFTDADNFWIQFPPGINPYLKALLMGATFLIDYMYFENR